MTPEWLAIIMFVFLLVVMLSGYPVAFAFAGAGFIFGLIGIFMGWVEFGRLGVLFSQWFRSVDDLTLLALPFFIFMGAVLEKAGLAERMLTLLNQLLGRLRGGLGIAVVVVGGILAASTGVVAIAVTVMGSLSLPTMLKYGYDKRLSTGVISASGSLAQIIPPSVILILLADMVNISIGKLFSAAAIPGIIMAVLFGVWVMVRAYNNPQAAPPIPPEAQTIKGWRLLLSVFAAVAPVLLLITAVFGSVVTGLATPTESGAVGAVGAMLLTALNKRLNIRVMYEAARDAALGSALIMFMLFTSLLFRLVFDQLGGHSILARWFSNMPGGFWSVVIVYCFIVLLLGVYMEYQDIIFVIVPIFVPVMVFLYGSGTTPFGGQESLLIWFTIVTGLSLNISFISPPVGFSLAYLGTVAPPEVKTKDIHRGALPFVALQALTLLIVLRWPDIVIWLPEIVNL